MNRDELSLTLKPPFLFDETIGYWTGRPDWEALARAMARVPQTPGVRRELSDEGLVLRGPREAVLSEAASLREAGLD